MMRWTKIFFVIVASIALPFFSFYLGTSLNSGIGDGGDSGRISEVAVPVGKGKGRLPAFLESKGENPSGFLMRGFVENQGQWPGQGLFRLGLKGVQVRLERDGWGVLVSRKTYSKKTKFKGRSCIDPEGETTEEGVYLKFKFLGASPRVGVAGLAPLAGKYNFILGRDPSKWKTNVESYREVKFQGLYPGIDVNYLLRNGMFTYDLHLSPEADLSRVVVEVRGADGLSLDPSGDLVIHTGMGDIYEKAPRAFERCSEGGWKHVPCPFVLLGANRFSFDPKGWGRANPLLLDPGLVFSTLLNGYGYGGNVIRAVKANSKGEPIVVGDTDTSTFPVTPGAYKTKFPSQYFNREGFVTHFDRKGKLVFSTFFGGQNFEYINALAIGGDGSITIAGETWSLDFPVTPGAFQKVHEQYSSDAFVARLDGSGSKLLYSTLLGGVGGKDRAFALSLGPKGVVLLTGDTYCTNFPVTSNAFDKSYGGKGYYYGDAFVTELDTSKSGQSALLYSTYLGGNNSDYGIGVVLEKGGRITVGGSTSSGDFPTTPGSYDPTFNNNPKMMYGDCYVTQIDPSRVPGKQLVFSTFVGSSPKTYKNHVFDGDDQMRGFLRIPWGYLFGGYTSSYDFPTTPGAWARQSIYENGFLTILSLDGKRLVASTYIGISEKTSNPLYGLDWDPSGWVVAVGRGGLPMLPATPTGFKQVCRKCPSFWDAFVMKFDAGLRRLLYSSFLGGGRSDEAHDVCIDGLGGAIITGETYSTDFPVTPGAFQKKYAGPFVTGMELSVRGVKRFGAATDSCLGAVTLYVLKEPKAGEGKFGFECWKAPPSSYGALLIGRKGLSSAQNLLGVDFWVDPMATILPILMKSDQDGIARVVLPLPLGAQGGKFYAQVIWANTPSCGGSGTLSASDALEVNVY